MSDPTHPRRVPDPVAPAGRASVRARIARVLAQPPASPVIRLAIALAVSAGAVAIRLVLLAGLGGSAPFLHSFPAIIALGWWLGFGPGVVVTFATAASSLLLFVAPIGQASPPSRSDLLALIVYLGVGVLLAWMADRFRIAQREAENARAEAQARAEHNGRLVRVRDGFASMLAHELRTPLTVILGDVVLLGRRRAELPADAVELVDDIAAETGRLRLLIEDLLVLNRDDADLELALEPISVRQVIAGVVAAGGRADELPDGLRVLVAPDLPLVQGDAIFLGQVLRNLLGNARKYGSAPYRLEAAMVAGAVAITVSDGGPGIPAGSEESIFDLFVRGPERRPGSPGAGVGLYVCRRLMRAMRGTIAVVPSPDGGAAFRLTLQPAREDD